jgi:hypothetical protein
MIAESRHEPAPEANVPKAFVQLQRTMTVGSLLLAAIFVPAALLAWREWGGTGCLAVTLTGASWVRSSP